MVDGEFLMESDSELKSFSKKVSNVTLYFASIAF